MTPRSSYTAARAPYTGLRPAFEALMRKKDASLSGGAYARDPRPGVTSTVRAANRSRFRALTEAEAGDGQLGMGIVQGILAALTGAVRAISWDSDGSVGRVTIDGVGSRETYQMSWDDRRDDYLLLGGFVNGATYQATLVGLTLLWTQRAINPGSRYSPIVKLEAMRSGAGGSRVKSDCSSPAWSSSEIVKGRRARPFSLTTRRRPTRSNSGAPSALSSAASAVLAADCDRATRSAAARVEPVRAKAANTSSWRSVRRSRR